MSRLAAGSPTAARRVILRTT
jgi:hypothetical protein